MTNLINSLCALITSTGLVVSPKAALLIWFVTVTGTFAVLGFLITHRKTLPTDQRRTLYALALLLASGTVIPLQLEVIYISVTIAFAIAYTVIKSSLGVGELKKHSSM